MFNLLKASLRKVTPPKVTISYTTWPWLEAEILEYFFFANKARHGCTEKFCLNVTMLFNDMQTQKIKSKLTLSFTLINQLIRPLRKQNFTSMSSNVHGL